MVPGTVNRKVGVQTMTEDAKTAKSGLNEQSNGGDEEIHPLEKIEITMDKRIDLAVTVGTILFGVFMLIEARKIELGTYELDPISSRGLPNITGLLLIIGGIVLAVRQLLIWRLLPGHLVLEEGQEDEKGHPISAVRATLIVILSILWELLLNPLGFLISSSAYMVACSLVMGVRSWRKIMGFSIILSIGLWYAFGPVLGVRLPLGPLENFVRSLGLIL
jgi:putative tricarboxylic transport membrane protein